MNHILLPDAEQRPLTFYLAMEEYVAAAFGCGFFVWRVAPTVIIGRNQILGDEVNLQYCREHGVDIVRRKSGGGCVYADRGNLMVSYITKEKGVETVFAEYLERFAAVLRSLGLDAVCTSHNDIMVGNAKVSGNAFFSLPGGSIVHGTLLQSVDFNALSQAITPSVQKLSKHGVQSVRQRVANLSELGYFGSGVELESSIIRAFCDGEVLLDAGQVEEIEKIEKTYRNPSFLLGKA